jgi:lysophospholipase L1-like esterase
MAIKIRFNCAEFDPVFTPSKTLLTWFLLCLAIILMVAVIPLFLRQYRLKAFFQALAATTGLSLPGKKLALQLTYQQRVAILEQEANLVALNRPQHLTVLAGDSLSDWFPADLLPRERTWLNQGIAGETSAGLLKRLHLFDRTQPETIFVMIGINDLLQGVRDETILENQGQIVRHLRQVHPNSQIVVQSILPYSGEGSNWARHSGLLAISNGRIGQLNRQLQAIAAAESVKYLDLHPLFTDAQGNLRADLSTDGLHLNSQGYLVWRSALQMYYSQLELEPRTGE